MLNGEKEQTIARGLAQRFYRDANYDDVYKNSPSGNHKQKIIQHPFAKTDVEVDELIAAIVVQIWQLRLDTIGSCQERPSGKAYIGFWLCEDGEKFKQILSDAGIWSELEEITRTMENPNDEELLLRCANVAFSPSDIERIEEALRMATSQLSLYLFAQQSGDFVDIFVASAGEADHDDLIG